MLGGRSLRGFPHSLPEGLDFILLIPESSTCGLQTKSQSWEGGVEFWVVGRGNTLLGLPMARRADECIDRSARHAVLFYITVAGD